MQQSGLPEAWGFTSGDAGPIAVINTVVDLDHPELTVQICTSEEEAKGDGADDDGNGYVDERYGGDFTSSCGDPNDDSGYRDSNGWH